MTSDFGRLLFPIGTLFSTSTYHYIFRITKYQVFLVIQIKNFLAHENLLLFHSQCFLFLFSAAESNILIHLLWAACWMLWNNQQYMEDKYILLCLYTHGAAISFSHFFYIRQACPFFERAFPMEAVLGFYHKEISLKPPGHTDILFHTGIQTFYCMDCIIQPI